MLFWSSRAVLNLQEFKQYLTKSWPSWHREIQLHYAAHVTSWIYPLQSGTINNCLAINLKRNRKISTNRCLYSYLCDNIDKLSLQGTWQSWVQCCKNIEICDLNQSCYNDLNGTYIVQYTIKMSVTKLQQGKNKIQIMPQEKTHLIWFATSNLPSNFCEYLFKSTSCIAYSVVSNLWVMTKKWVMDPLKAGGRPALINGSSCLLHLPPSCLLVNFSHSHLPLPLCDNNGGGHWLANL